MHVQFLLGKNLNTHNTYCIMRTIHNYIICIDRGTWNMEPVIFFNRNTVAKHIFGAISTAFLGPQMHQNRWRLGLRPRPHWGSLQRSPRRPSWSQGALLLRGGEGRGGKGKGGKVRDREGREVPKRLDPQSQKPSYAPCV